MYLTECNKLIRACIAYYELNQSIIDDAEYDKLSYLLANHFDELSDYHKQLFMDPDSLKATGFYILKRLGPNARHWHIKTINGDICERPN